MDSIRDMGNPVMILITDSFADYEISLEREEPLKAPKTQERKTPSPFPLLDLLKVQEL